MAQVQGSTSGPKLTVNMLLNSPTLIPARVVDLASQQYLPDRILRDVGPINSGVIGYRDTEPLFANDDAPIVEEYAEIPITGVQLGALKAAQVVYRAEGILASERELKRWNNNSAEFQRRIGKVVNSAAKTWNVAFMNLILNNASIQTQAALASWKAASGSTLIRKDIAIAIQSITEADADTSNGTGVQKQNYEPDTLLINPTTAASLVWSDEISKLFLNSPITSQSPLFTGQFPRQLLDLNVIKSRQVPANKAILLQSKVIGGIGDEMPLFTEPPYFLKERRTWRSDVIRGSAMFLDNPKAVCVITGVDA